MVEKKVPSVTGHRTARILLIAAVFVLLLALVAGALFSPRNMPFAGLALALLAFALAAAACAVLLQASKRSNQELQRRQEELAVLRQVSQVMRSTLDLEPLLEEIQRLVTGLLHVDNFYVALYDPQGESISYPLAVKNGLRQSWPARPVEDRLTDRVIREGRPLLYPRDLLDGQESSDLPASESTPTAWIGAPLISPARTLGCLALFSLAPQAEFRDANLDLLTTLSGPISVAIENALLYQQARQRAAQMENLTRISSLITASLEPQETLAQVCRSASSVGGGDHSAIYLLSEGGMVELAAAYELSKAFTAANGSFPVEEEERARCLRSGHAFLAPNLARRKNGSAFLRSLHAEGIAAYGDFPLITSEGQIGFLSVYFHTPHSFTPEEVELLQTYATQAALAVSNARLYTRTGMELSQRVRQLSILEVVGRMLAAATHSEHLFDLILGFAREFTGSPWGCIGLYEPATGQVAIRAAAGYPAPPASMPVEAGVSGRAVRTQGVVNVAEVRGDPDYVDLVSGAARSQISIPLAHEGQVLGMLTLENETPGGYSAGDEAFLRQLADQAAIALVNAGLLAEASQGRDRLSAVLNSVQEGILMVETGGQVTLINEAAAQMSGLAVGEALGKRLDELPEPALRLLGFTGDLAELARPPAGWAPEPSRLTLRLNHLIPERIVERTTLPVWGSGERSLGWMVVLRDVTEEQRVAEAREMITETLVHDLRSPLSAVQGALDLIEISLPAGEPGELLAQAQRVARRGTQRVLSMVESLLDISRMQAGKMDVLQEPLDLHSLAAVAMSEFIPQANEYGIILRNEITPELPVACGDPAKIARVLSNLLDNALKYTPEGGQVIFSAEAPGNGQVQVRVSDTGPGIPEEYRRKIFDRFTQVPGQRGRRRGSGLGLTFCKLAVEAHGGRIWVEERPGGGSVFAFTLPQLLLPTRELENW